jgi:hypothetical protein
MIPPRVLERWTANSDPELYGELTASEFGFHFSSAATAIRREIAWSTGQTERMVYDEQCGHDYLNTLRAALEADGRNGSSGP